LLACCGSNAPVAGDSMIGRNKEGPMVKQRADEVLKNPAKDTVSSPFSNWRKHGTEQPSFIGANARTLPMI
jgi:hypothetical protein